MPKSAGELPPSSPTTDRPIGRYRNVIAMTMLLIASVGAMIAGWTAIKQQSSTVLGRKIGQAQMMELSDRAQISLQSQVAQRIQKRQEGHLAESQSRRAMAARLRTSDPDQAHLLDLAGSEAFLLAGASRPFLAFLPNVIGEDMNLDERRIGLVAAMTLQRKGLKASWTEPVAGAGASPAAARLELTEKAEQRDIDQQVIGLSFVVVGFVVSLVLLTLADLGARRRGASLLAYGSALATAAACLAAALVFDAALLPLVGSIAVTYLAFIGVCAALGWLKAGKEESGPSQPQSIDTQGFAGGQLQISDGQTGTGRFSRLMVIAIALTALISSVIGYWYAIASSRADDAAQSAYEQQLDVVKLGGRSTTSAMVAFEALIDLHEQRIRCLTARNRTVLAADGKIKLAPGGGAAEEASRCESLEEGEPAGDGQAGRMAELDRRFGPQADPRYPFRLFQYFVDETPAGDASEPLAMWDGYSEQASFWNAKSTTFLASLTIVAIALYIFGQSLAMAQVRATVAMAGCGVIMTLAAIGWSAAVWFAPAAAPAVSLAAGCLVPKGLARDTVNWSSEEAMGVAALNFAGGVSDVRTAEKEAEFASAIARFDCAIAARPNFSLAHTELAEAKAISQSAHRGNAFYSLPNKDRLEEMLANAKAALAIAEEQGAAPNAYALNTYAVSLWAIGVRDGKLSSLKEAHAAVHRAIRWAEPLEANRQLVSRDPHSNLYPWLSVLPLLYLNESLFLIANDRLEEGRMAADKALALGVSRDWGMAASMTTATALLDNACARLHPAERCAAIHGALKSYRQALLTGTWSGDAATTPPVEGRFRTAVASSQLLWAARMPDIDLKNDQISVVWHVADQQWGTLDALPQVNPQVAASQMRRSGSDGLASTNNVLIASGFKRCLAPGTYKAELFRNGQPFGADSAELKGLPLVVARSELLNLAMCHPESWKPWKPAKSKERLLWPMLGFVTPEGQPAAFLFAIPLPDSPQSAAERNAYAVDRALRMLIESNAIQGPHGDLKGRLHGCANAPAGALLQAVTRGSGGIAYAAIVSADAIDRTRSCDIVNSITIMH
jgi:hypothetical protein